MTKADIVEQLFETAHGAGEQTGFSKKESSEIVEQVFEAIKAALEQGDKVKLSGFGSFLLREKKPRMGRNPQSGRAIEITARRVLTFHPSQLLKEALNVSPEGATGNSVTSS